VRTRSVALRSLFAAVPVGLLLAGALVWQSTSAAFTATTDNTGNTWQAGTVVLRDNDGGSAMFDSAANANLRPGSTRPRCIRVDYTGNLAADIRLFVTTPSSDPATTLDPYLVMSVERGQDVDATTTVAPDCTGFTSTPTMLYNNAAANLPAASQTKTMSTLKTDSATGLSVGPPVAANTSLTFRITYSVRDDNNAQNTRSTATFTWEARNV